MIDDRRRLRVGVVGSGNWARAAHLPSFAAHPGAELVAIAGIDRGEAEQTAGEFGIVRVYENGQAMIASEQLDLVSIVTPDDAHVPDAIAAMGAGLHVLCEKPLAVTVEEARELAELAVRADVRTKMGFTMRYAPAVRALKTIVASGELGDLHLLEAFQQNGQFLDPDKVFHWKMDPARTGGGAIVEYGIHTLDLARWLMGEAVSVAAISRTLVRSRPDAAGGTRPVTVDDSTGWLMAFAGGAMGVCHAGWATAGRGPGLELRVYGTQGAASCRLSDELAGGEALSRTDADLRLVPVEIPVEYGADVPLDWPWWRRFNYGLIGDFIAEINGDLEPSATFVDGLAAQELLAAVQAAAREQRWVAVSSASGR